MLFLFLLHFINNHPRLARQTALKNLSLSPLSISIAQHINYLQIQNPPLHLPHLRSKLRPLILLEILPLRTAVFHTFQERFVLLLFATFTRVWIAELPRDAQIRSQIPDLVYSSP